MDSEIPKWRSPSHSGWGLLTCHPRSLQRFGDREVLCCQVRLEGQFWNRTQVAAGDFGELSGDYDLQLSQVMISIERLVSATEALAKWLADYEPFSMRLTEDSGQTLSMTIGPDPRLISTQHKPALV